MHCANIDFSLTAARHPVQQIRRERARTQRLFDRAQRVCLRGRQFEIFRLRKLRARRRIAANVFLGFFDDAVLDQSANDRLADPGSLRQFIDCQCVLIRAKSRNRAFLGFRFSSRRRVARRSD